MTTALVTTIREEFIEVFKFSCKLVACFCDITTVWCSFNFENDMNFCLAISLLFSSFSFLQPSTYFSFLTNLLPSFFSSNFPKPLHVQVNGLMPFSHQRGFTSNKIKMFVKYYQTWLNISFECWAWFGLTFGGTEICSQNNKHHMTQGIVFVYEIRIHSTVPWRDISLTAQHLYFYIY